ncbi:BtrH N-terminal domain-containing protein [Carnobacterium maltaromaticum]|uniref:BtrH N-terminal domain-containing protein n=1 Tax=Carnobacterium maltaromaticum TaxID=2751 RepID=UPI0039BDBDD2
MLIEKYPIYKGEHCSSTAISEIAQFYGMNLSEELIFGLSSGLDFLYFSLMDIRNSRVYFPRVPMLEKNFFENTTFEFKWVQNDNIKSSAIEAEISKGKPVLAMVDTSKLDFFNRRNDSISISPHVCTIIGCDNQSFYISDSINNKLNICRKDSLFESMNVEKAPFFKKNCYSTIEYFELKNSIEYLSYIALRKNAKTFLNNNNDVSGLNAIKKMIYDIDNFDRIPNYNKCASGFFYSIEIIGTGGSAFRKLYLKFLKETNHYFSDSSILVYKMEELCIQYLNLGKSFDRFSRRGIENDLKKAKKILEYITILEFEFWESVLQIVK